MTSEMELLARLVSRAQADGADRSSRLDDRAVRQAEAALGFALHPLLATVYREVADGGFGPDYQLLSLIGESAETAVGEYLSRRSENAGTDWAWPEGVLPILHWGCGMYACVDCRSPAGTVLLFEPNPGDPHLAWYVDSPSLAGWFTHYVEDTGWWVAAEDGEDVDEMPPWPDAAARA
jgi:SMI1 / KNR4 family (SUKH-1)